MIVTLHNFLFLCSCQSLYLQYPSHLPFFSSNNTSLSPLPSIYFLLSNSSSPPSSYLQNISTVSDSEFQCSFGFRFLSDFPVMYAVFNSSSCCRQRSHLFSQQVVGSKSCRYSVFMFLKKNYQFVLVVNGIASPLPSCGRIPIGIMSVPYLMASKTHFNKYL